MAAGEQDPLTKIRQVQELFHGRFTGDEVRILLEIHDWDQDQAVNFVFTAESVEIRQAICAHDENYNPEEFDARCLDGIDLANEWSVVENNRRSISKTSRQFACQDCDNVWWKKVPSRKMVSKCFRCRRKYEALPRESEWGLAEFQCECGQVFRGFCQRITSSRCFTCYELVKPCRIIPHENTGHRPRERRRDTHSCNAPDCFYRRSRNGRMGRGRGSASGYTVMVGANGTNTCVHPQYRNGVSKPRVVVPSTPHHSSGSTIDTCLSQDDLLDRVSVIYDIDSYREISMPTIPESDTEAEDGSPDNGAGD